MIQQIIVRRLAVDDAVEAAAWYEKQAAGLGEELIDEILRAIRRPLLIPSSSVSFVATERFDGSSRNVFPIEFSSQSSRASFTFTPSCMARSTIVDGRNECNF